MTTVPMLRRPNPKRRGCAPGVHPLVVQFIALVEESGAAISDVSERAGYSPCVPVRWKCGRHKPTLPAFEDHLRTLGYRLVIVGLPETDLADLRNAPARLLRHKLKAVELHLGDLVHVHGTAAQMAMYRAFVRGIEDIAEQLDSTPLGAKTGGPKCAG
jgi:hypothetical protein